MNEPRTTPERFPYLIPAGALALGLVIAALVFGLFFHASRGRVDTIQVVGSASEQFTADIAKWRVTISRQVPEHQTAAGYEHLRRDVQEFAARITGAGISPDQISVQPVNSQPYWGREGGREGYLLNQPLFVISENPEALEQLARNPGVLLGDAALESSILEYYYSEIAALKHSLLAAATRDARQRAEEIAGASAGFSLGGLQSARAGVFQITEPYSTEVGAMGIHTTSTREKEITVTVHAVFRAR